MSDNYIVLVPTDPYFIPATESHEHARRILERAAPDAMEVTIHVHDSPEVIIMPETWDGVRCPRCGATLDDWWFEAVGTAYESEFSNLFVDTPCCGHNVSLNDLDYVLPVGFARFELSVMNPDLYDIDVETKAELEGVLGTPLRRIWLRV